MIGEAVRKERQRQDITEDYFASLCLMTTDNLKKIESGKEMPTMVDLVIMSNILKISFGHLMNGEIRPQDDSIEAEKLLDDIRKLGSDIREMIRDKEMLLEKAQKNRIEEQNTEILNPEQKEKTVKMEKGTIPVGTRFQPDAQEKMRSQFTIEMIRDPGFTENTEAHYHLDRDEDGIHVFDTTRYDPETGEYSEVAQMTNDGKVTYYEKTTEKERQEISEEMNREKNPVPKAVH